MVEPTHLKNTSQIGSFPQVAVKMRNVRTHHLDLVTSWCNCCYGNNLYISRKQIQRWWASQDQKMKEKNVCTSPNHLKTPKSRPTPSSGSGYSTTKVFPSRSIKLTAWQCKKVRSIDLANEANAGNFATKSTAHATKKAKLYFHKVAQLFLVDRKS